MAILIVHIGPDENLSEHGDWVLVERDSPGRYAAGEPMIEHGRGATFYVSEPALESDLEAAIDKAISWAEEHQLETVYVRETLHPHRN